MKRAVLTVLLTGILVGCDRPAAILEEQACYEAKRALAESYEKYWHYAKKPDQKENDGLAMYWAEVGDEAMRWKSRVCKSPSK